MKPSEFLKSELEHIAKKFPNVHIKYGFNDTINTHIVELLPLIEYNNNKDLGNAWVPIFFKFMDTFKSEEITFISSDSSLTLSTILFELNQNACNEECIITGLFEPFTRVAVYYEFPTFMQNGILIGDSSPFIINSIIVEPTDSSYLETYSEAA